MGLVKTIWFFYDDCRYPYSFSIKTTPSENPVDQRERKIAMCHYLPKISILILIFATMTDGCPQDSTQPLPFNPGQSVYIVAMKSSCSPDFEQERLLREEFMKENFFKVATSLQSADFVFLVYLDYGVRVSGSLETTSGSDYIKSAAALAVSPATYTQFKSNPYLLRDEALWKIPNGFHHTAPKNLQAISSIFHQDMRISERRFYE
jgi:hypothetical protein